MMKEILNIYIVLVFVSIYVLILTTSCSSGEGKEVLSFFFDGIKDSVASENVDSVITVNQNSENVTSKRFFETTHYHEPYKDKLCDNCHETKSSNQLTESQPALCYNCHDDFSTQFSFLHGPVAAGYCTNCHHPHMSKNQKLLKRTGQELCLECHEQNDILRNDIHSDIDGTDCTECHNPHGGEDKFLM